MLHGVFIFLFSALERRISVRKSRQELIDRGVLKDIPENGWSIFVLEFRSGCVTLGPSVLTVVLLSPWTREQ